MRYKLIWKLLEPLNQNLIERSCKQRLMLEALQKVTSYLDAVIFLADDVCLKETVQVYFSEDERS